MGVAVEVRGRKGVTNTTKLPTTNPGITIHQSHDMHDNSHQKGI
jgi:hypothetical protein